MTDATRIGVVGVSGIGTAHLFAVSALDDEAQLTAVCDVDDGVEKVAGDFGARAFHDADELFASGEVDVVVLAVPPFLHAPLTRRALDAGLHVLCEKPLAPTFTECAALARLADEHRRVVQVGHQYRFLPAHREARRIVAAGEIGEIFRVNLTATGWFRPQRYFDDRPWRRDWKTGGGGVLLSQAIHQLDAVVSIAGLPSRVAGRAWRWLHDAEVEDDVMAMLEFPSGARGFLVASIADPVGEDRIEIHGERGSLVLEGQRLRRATFDGGSVHDLSSSPDRDVFAAVDVQWDDVVVAERSEQREEFEAIKDLHRDLLAAIRDGRPPLNHPEESAKAIAVANAVYLSAVRDEPVTLPVADGEYERVFEDLGTGRTTIPRLAGLRPDPPTERP